MSEQGQARVDGAGGGGELVRTVLFSDVVSSSEIRTRLRARSGYEDGESRFLAEILEPHNERLLACFTRFGGTVFSEAGDGYGVAFDVARRAVLCAIECQRSFLSRPMPVEVAGEDVSPHVEIRIGLHRGEARRIFTSGRENYSGRDVDAAHRILEITDGGQVLTSDATWQAAGDLTAEGIRRHDLGSCALKGVGSLHVVELLWDDREPRAPKRDSAKSSGDSRPTRRATPFSHLGACWEVRERFFEVHRRVDSPDAQTLRDAIHGPRCARCSSALWLKVRRSWLSAEIPASYRIRNACPGCGHPRGSAIAARDADDLRLEVYQEAQRLMLRGESFPAGDCERALRDLEY